MDQGFNIPKFVNQICHTRTGRELGDHITYNNYMRKKQPKPRMEAEKLILLASEGYEYLNTVWMADALWCNVRTDMEKVITLINKYGQNLKNKNKTMQQRHFSSSSISNPIENGIVITIELCDIHEVDTTFRSLDNLISDEDEYCPIFLNDLDMIQSMDKRMRYKFFKSLEATHLSKPIVYFTYSLYSGINSYHFVWILPAESDARDDSQFAKIVTAISQDIPKYHTRHMCASFRETFSSLVSAKPVLLDEMYRYLTNDCSTSWNNASKEVRAHLLLAMTCEDTDVVVDLREHNGSPEKYSEFWEGVNDVRTRDFPSATEER